MDAGAAVLMLLPDADAANDKDMITWTTMMTTSTNDEKDGHQQQHLIMIITEDDDDVCCCHCYKRNNNINDDENSRFAGQMSYFILLFVTGLMNSEMSKSLQQKFPCNVLRVWL